MFIQARNTFLHSGYLNGVCNKSRVCQAYSPNKRRSLVLARRWRKGLGRLKQVFLGISYILASQLQKPAERDASPPFCFFKFTAQILSTHSVTEYINSTTRGQDLRLNSHLTLLLLSYSRQSCTEYAMFNGSLKKFVSVLFSAPNLHLNLAVH